VTNALAVILPQTSGDQSSGAAVPAAGKPAN
jgi:hypothetical protein